MRWTISSLKWPLLVVIVAGGVAAVGMAVRVLLDLEESHVPCCSLWLLLIPFGVATAAAWERKVPAIPPMVSPRCHQCDYDLTGNVSGICPECGTPIPAPPSQQELDALTEKTRRRWALVREGVLLVCTILAGLICAYTFATSLHHPLGLKGTIRNSLPAFLVSVVFVMVYVDQRRRR